MFYMFRTTWDRSDVELALQEARLLGERPQPDAVGERGEPVDRRGSDRARGAGELALQEARLLGERPQPDAVGERGEPVDRLGADHDLGVVAGGIPASR